MWSFVAVSLIGTNLWSLYCGVPSTAVCGDNLLPDRAWLGVPLLNSYFKLISARNASRVSRCSIPGWSNVLPAYTSETLITLPISTVCKDQHQPAYFVIEIISVVFKEIDRRWNMFHNSVVICAENRRWPPSGFELPMIAPVLWGREMLDSC
jgi:hypothetical protein